MILVDTSIWVDHLGRAGDPILAELLEDGQVMTHPFVIGELALGNLARRQIILDSLKALPQAKIADVDEAFHLLHEAELHGLGIGYVDLHLLAAARLTEGARLWTRDRRLAQACSKSGVPAFGTH